MNSIKDTILSVFSNKKSILIIGIGGGGSNIVNNISKNNPLYLPVIINSDLQAMESKNIQHKIYLSKPKGYGCGGNTNCGINLVTDDTTQKLSEYIGKKKRVFIVVTLGGGVGSGSIQPISKFLSSKGIKIVLFLVFPFKFEGVKKFDTATKTVTNIQKYASNIFIIHNEHILDNYTSHSMRDGFSIVDKTILKAIKKYKSDETTQVKNLDLI